LPAYGSGLKSTGSSACHLYVSTADQGWAYRSIIAHDARAKRFFERKRDKTSGIVAIRAVAHKLARASYCMLRDQTPYAAARVFG